jgi:hypothetical protein
LPIVVHAADADAFGFCLSQGRKEHAGKDCDNSDHDQEFNQSESRSVGVSVRSGGENVDSIFHRVLGLF